MFVSEPIEPEAGTFDPAVMSSGLASLPASFLWRDRRYRIVDCLRHAKQSGTEGHKAGGERYLRRQVFTVVLDTGQTAEIYVERQSRGRTTRAAKQRWYLYSIDPGPEGQPA